ncbi:MAG: glycosyl transferase [Actinomycetales bacterium]|nr:MAG: glycosyl transferase [Actinomycetales bacterium]
MKRRRILQGADLTVGLLASLLAHYLRFGFESTPVLVVVFVIPFVWLSALVASGTYTVAQNGVGSDEYRAIGRAAFTTFAGVAIASYLLHAELSRGVVMPLSVFLLIGTIGVHALHRRHLARERTHGRYVRDVLVMGRADACVAIIMEMQASPVSGYRVVGACITDDDVDQVGSRLSGVPIVGTAGEAMHVVDRLGIDVVAVSSDPDLSGQNLRRIGWALAERRVDLVVAPGIFEVAGPRLSLRPVAGLSLLHVERPADGWFRLLSKRLMDTVLAGALTLVALPIGLVVAALIKLDSPGPVFFRQERVGAHGERFKMIKFRSMCQFAEARKSSIDGGNKTNTVLFKVKEDPRVTRVGKVIRRLSIDELPQLLNVLKGDMSLVGPRPPLPNEVDQYEADAMQRLRVRPGMTGMWQISGRSDLDWEQSLRLDLWYVDNWSPMLDLQILARTGRAVLAGHGAY